SNPKVGVIGPAALHLDPDRLIDQRLIHAGEKLPGALPLVESEGVVVSRPDVREFEASVVGTPCCTNELRLLERTVLRRQDHRGAAAVVHRAADHAALRLENDL